jgi:hypothetical protein
MRSPLSFARLSNQRCDRLDRDATIVLSQSIDLINRQRHLTIISPARFGAMDVRQFFNYVSAFLKCSGAISL